MNNLTSFLPNLDLLIALSPEDLAEILLPLAKEHRHNRLIDFGTIRSKIDGLPHRENDFPAGLRHQAEQALAEAWTWLVVNGLLVPDPSENGRNGWMLLSRRAEEILDTGCFKKYARGIHFPKELLHPSIADEVWLELARGDLEAAVFKSFRAVEIAVRSKGNFSADDYGVPLMRKAFDRHTGPLSDMNRPEAERDALSHLFAGAIGSYKNPHSHRTVLITEPTEAQEMVMLASHLLRIIDRK